MYILSDADYSRTSWYKRILSPMKAEARRKRIQLSEATHVTDLPAGESCAFVLGGGEGWILDTVRALHARGCHPVLLSEIDTARLSGRFSRVRCDYESIAFRLTKGRGRCALYGINPTSAADTARRRAFGAVHPTGAVFENNASLSQCFEAFWKAHTKDPFDCVLCANDLAAVSLYTHLGERKASAPPRIAVSASGALLSFFPAIQTVRVDPASLSRAAFEIADCIKAHPDFMGITVSVGAFEECEGSAPAEEALPTASVGEAEPNADPFYADPEMRELLHIERLLSSLDETDLKILSLLSRDCRDIGEEAYLSDNGVKYRLKKMKQLCGVASKREIPVLLGKYHIQL